MNGFLALLAIVARATADVSQGYLASLGSATVGGNVAARAPYGSYAAPVGSYAGPVSSYSGLDTRYGTASFGSVSYGVSTSTVAISYPMLGVGFGASCFPDARFGVTSLCYGVPSSGPVISFSSTSVSYTVPTVRYHGDAFVGPNYGVAASAPVVSYSPRPAPAPTASPSIVTNSDYSSSTPAPATVATESAPVADFPVFDSHDAAPAHTYSEDDGYVYKTPSGALKR